jgi:hypothetical protein
MAKHIDIQPQYELTRCAALIVSHHGQCVKSVVCGGLCQFVFGAYWPVRPKANAQRALMPLERACLGDLVILRHWGTSDPIRAVFADLCEAFQRSIRGPAPALVLIAVVVRSR